MIQSAVQRVIKICGEIIKSQRSVNLSFMEILLIADTLIRIVKTMADQEGLDFKDMCEVARKIAADYIDITAGMKI